MPLLLMAAVAPCSAIDDLHIPSDYEHEFVKFSIAISLDRTDRERELISRMLSELVPSLLAVDAISACSRCTYAAVH